MQMKIKLRSKSNVCYYPHPPTQNPPTQKKTKNPKKTLNSPRRRSGRGPTTWAVCYPIISYLHFISKPIFHVFSNKLTSPTPLFKASWRMQAERIAEALSFLIAAASWGNLFSPDRRPICFWQSGHVWPRDCYAPRPNTNTISKKPNGHLEWHNYFHIGGAEVVLILQDDS